MVTVRDPRKDSDLITKMQTCDQYQTHRERRTNQQPTLTFSYAVLPIEMEYQMMKAYESKNTSVDQAKQMMRSQLGGYTRSLNLDDGPPETLPRLPSNPDGTIDVPLYNDPKTH